VVEETMPKYFEGTKALPPNVIKLDHGLVCLGKLTEILKENKENKENLILSVHFSELPSNSLGYIFFIKTINNRYYISDIKGVPYFKNIDVAYLVRIIRHASGIEFYDDIQVDFYRIRNEIGLD
jgi:hypothetical protein